MAIDRLVPPHVAQTLEDSCWAAVLESWSRVDLCLVRQEQSALIARWGEGPTGGITPARKIPLIAHALGLQWGAFRSGREVSSYLQRHLPDSHIFFAYTVSRQFTHSVLIYRLEGDDLWVMDPDRGRHRRRSLSWLGTRDPFVLLRRL
jgi:hypothetical protein